MISWLSLLVLVVSAWWWYNKDQARFSKYPPGPPRLPYIGNIVQMLSGDRFPAKAFKDISDKYGDLIFLKLGPGEAVIASSPESIKKMITHEKAQDRVQFQFTKDRSGGRNIGLAWHIGPTWSTMSRFTIRTLREFGFGKSSTMEIILAEEVTKWVQFIKDKASKSADNVIHVENIFNTAVTNVLWSMVSGKQYDYDDSRMATMLQLNTDFFKSTNIGFDISECYPVIRDWFPNWTGRNEQIRTSQQLVRFATEMLEEHKVTWKKDTESKSFLDVFREKIEATKNDPNSLFTEEQLLFVILDLFLGGSETSSFTLTFGILYMLLYPEVQGKVHKELDSQLPAGATLDSSMKARLPYTMATILETYRYSSVAPLPPARQATEDFDLCGYEIKKGTALMFNVFAVHFDEKLWGDPHNFRPERFLTPDGASIEQRAADQLQVFGAGKRGCPGRIMGETAIFIYFASALRKFRFEKVPGTNPTAEQVLGVTMMPKPFDVKIVERVWES